MMEIKNFLFIFVCLFLLVGTVSAKSEDNFKDKEIIKFDGKYENDEKIKNKELLDVWIENYEIDKNKNRVYHVDSKIKGKVSKNLEFFYEVQPDYIDHYNHNKKYVETYYPENWYWKINCTSEEECTGGYLTFQSNGIIEGIGSSTYPIGITGPQWRNNSNFSLMTENIDYTFVNEQFNVLNGNYYLLINYDVYHYSESYESSVELEDSFFYIDLAKRQNLLAVFLYFVVAVSLLFFKLKNLSAMMFLFGGFLLIFSGIHFLISLVPFIASLILVER